MISDTPTEIDEVVLIFCEKVVKSSSPVWVNVQPDEESIQDDCFHNVNDRINKDGGEIVHGWQIWLVKDKFIEAEFHAVWKSSNGELIDITPKDIPTEKILFIEDKSKVYEGKDIDNVRMNLTSNQLVDEFIILSKSRFTVISSGRINGSMRVDLNAGEFSEIEMTKQVLISMIDNDSSRNSLCHCNSGDKYKHCHGRIVNKIAKKYDIGM